MPDSAPDFTPEQQAIIDEELRKARKAIQAQVPTNAKGEAVLHKTHQSWTRAERAKKGHRSTSEPTTPISH